MKTQLKIISGFILLLGAGFLPRLQACLPGSNFISGSHLGLKLSNVWMLNTTDTFSELGVSNQNAWAQGIHLDWQSGWAWDSVGFDASWYGASKLYSNKDFAGRDLLRDNNGRAEGFNKFGQVYAKARWGDQRLHLSLWAGWKQLYKLGALSVTRSRAVPSSWQGISSELVWDKLTAKAALVDRFSERDEPEKRRFMTLKSNKRIDYIATGELSWVPEKGSKVSFITAESKNYLLRHGLEANTVVALSPKANLLARGVYYYARGLGEWEGVRAFTHSAQHWFGLVGYQFGASESGVGWSYTRARLNNGLGQFYWQFGKNTRGAFNSKADGEGNDYVKDGESMVYLYSQYRINPALQVGVYGNYGDGMKYGGVSLKEWEYGGFISWDVPQVKGLNVFSGFGPSYGWKINAKQNPLLSHDGKTYRRAKGIGGTVRVEYLFNLF